MLMRDIYQVLYRKEQELQQLRREIEVLRIVIPLLQDEADARLSAGESAVIPFERPRSSARYSPSPLSR
jgi:hypothetical protein